MTTGSFGWILPLLSLAASAEPAQVLRCTIDDAPAEYVRVSMTPVWEDWEDITWSPPLCGLDLVEARGTAQWRCEHSAQAYVLVYSVVDRLEGGVYRRVDTIDRLTGGFHRRIVDTTFVPEGGARLELNWYGSCVSASPPDE